MHLKKILAGALLAGTLTFGAATIASAESSPNPTTTPTTPTAPTAPTAQQCQRAQNVWQRLQNLDERAHTNYQKLVDLRDKASAAGKTEVVAKIDARLERLRDRHDKIVARMQALHDKAQGRCEIGEPDTSAL